MLGSGSAGLATAQSDPKKLIRWTSNVLNMVRDIFVIKQDDAYVAWLRPDHSNPPELVYFASEGLKDEHKHHTFTAGEGLAGNAWSQGQSVGHSPGRPHPWWVLRKGCENMAYLCPCRRFQGIGRATGCGVGPGI